jgi:hypothetical protein
MLNVGVSQYLPEADLASVSRVSRDVQGQMKDSLIQRRMWKLGDIDGWSNERKRLVRHLFVDFLQEQAIPAGVTHLTFGPDFNQPVEAGVLPAGLTHLTFGMLFNQPIPVGVLRAGLTHLTFGDVFNRPGVLPDTLTHWRRA